MGQIRVWRADRAEKTNFASNVEQIRAKVRNTSIEKYGRPDVPSYVQRAAESYALRRRISNRDALNALVTEAGSLDVLVSDLLKEHKKRTKKANKLEREKIETAKRGTSTHSALQKAIEASKRSKYISFVPGGAPGLGKRK